MLEILVFITQGTHTTNNEFIKKIRKEYDNSVINYYFPNSNNFLMNYYKIKKIPSAIILKDDKEIGRI